jgi:hypothetical protein
MSARLELTGVLASRKDIGRTVKGKKFNQQKDKDSYYDLDDDFIDDGDVEV